MIDIAFDFRADLKAGIQILILYKALVDFLKYHRRLFRSEYMTKKYSDSLKRFRKLVKK